MLEEIGIAGSQLRDLVETSSHKISSLGSESFLGKIRWFTVNDRLKVSNQFIVVVSIYRGKLTLS